MLICSPGAGGTDRSEIKSTCCSPRGSGCDHRHPHGSSSLTVTPVPEDTMPLLTSLHTGHANDSQTYIQKKHIKSIDF